MSDLDESRDEREREVGRDYISRLMGEVAVDAWNAPGGPGSDLDPGTRIGVEVGPSRAIGRWDFAPVVHNDDHVPIPIDPPRWCIRRGGLVPRLHRPEHFLLFDPGLPHYRRCPRCGASLYLLKGGA